MEDAGRGPDGERSIGFEFRGVPTVFDRPAGGDHVIGASLLSDELGRVERGDGAGRGGVVEGHEGGVERAESIAVGGGGGVGLAIEGVFDAGLREGGGGGRGRS